MASINASGGPETFQLLGVASTVEQTRYRYTGAYAQDDGYGSLAGGVIDEQRPEQQGLFDPWTDTMADWAVGSTSARSPHSNQLNGHIRAIRYYNERLADSVIEDMSNGIFPAVGGSAFVNDLVTDLVYDLPLDLTS